MTNWKPDVVLYHANCADGFGAAWVASTYWGRDGIDYIPVNYGESPPCLSGKNVLIGDFSYKHHVTDGLLRQVESLVILDHHKTAEEELYPFAIHLPGGACKSFSVKNIDDHFKIKQNWKAFKSAVLFDMERSGARMMWDFCYPDKPVPLLISLIEDYDLWNHNLLDSEAFALYLRSDPFSFDHWNSLNSRLEISLERELIMAEARAMNKFFLQKVNELVGIARMGNIGGHTVPIVNCPKAFVSKTGNRLLDVYPNAAFSACYFDREGVREYSLRSEDGREDVSQITKRYGGGGHRNAAGFTVPLV